MTRSFVFPTRRESLTSNWSGPPVPKRKKQHERANAIETTEFLGDLIADDRNISRVQFQILPDIGFRQIGHEDPRYQTYLMKGRQFMSDETRQTSHTVEAHFILVMTLRIGNNDGHVMKPIKFPQCLRVKANAYIETLNTVVELWREASPGR